MQNIHIKAVEKDLYMFFKEVGAVRDIQIIRDQRTNKSKGVAYIEFYKEDSVQGALGMSGRMLMLSPVRVSPSQAEKNRAMTAAKAAAADGGNNPNNPFGNNGMKIKIGGLVGALENITEDDLRKLFSSFGSIEFIDLHKDPNTGKCIG